MSWLEAIVLAVLQGFTEFLPVSSSGHLAVAGYLFDQWQPGRPGDPGNLFYDVMLHVGTLVAILVFYRRTGWDAARGLAGSQDVPPEMRRQAVIRAGILAGCTVLPMIPVGLFLKDHVERLFQSPVAAGIGFLITATELLLVSRLPEGKKSLMETTWRDALLVGLAQAFAVLPGVSRSGTTIAAALALGFRRSWAVGFSLLMAVPAIAGAAVLEARDLDAGELANGMLLKVLVGVLIAAVIGYTAILWLLKIVRRGRLWYFSVYLVIVATALLLAVTRPAPSSTAAERGVVDAEAQRHEESRTGSAALDRSSRFVVVGQTRP